MPNPYVELTLNLAKLLPGVNIKVLGPPTLKQYEKIKKQRSRDDDEFWMLQAAAKSFWGMQAATAKLAHSLIEEGEELFPDAESYTDFTPSHSRWLVRRIREIRADQLLQIVRIMDKAMNNTSVILLFETVGKKLLFPSDAQIENWEYALGQKDKLKPVQIKVL